MLKVEPVRPFVSNKFNNIKYSEYEKTSGNNQLQIRELSGIPRSYISFRAEKNNELNYTDEGRLLIEKAQKIAQEKGNSELTPYHIIEAAIEETKENETKYDSDTLESGVISSISTLNLLAERQADKNLLIEKDLREYFFTSVDNLQAENQEYLNKLPVSEDKVNTELTLSNDFKDLLLEAQSQGAKMDAYNILGTAFNTLTARGNNYAIEFLKDFISLNYYKSSEELSKNYMKSYDNRAIEVWNKLALGSNLFINYSDSKEGDRIISSLIKTINVPKHGDFSRKNTLIYPISENITSADLLEEVSEISEAEPDKRKIFIVNLDAILAKSINPETNELVYPAEIIGLVNSQNDNLVKFIFLQNKENYYKSMQNPIIKKGFSNFIAYSIPPIHTYEAQEIINKSRKYTKDIKLPFSKEARNKAIAYADRIDGVFPDKAVDLMKRIADYYGSSKKRINVKEVDEFASVAKEIFNNNSDETNIVYDTGKNISSLYGKDTTKKDVEAIVRQIHTGKIGTRGYVMYSKDIEAGSGRRFTAQAIAGEAKVPFIEIASSDFALNALDEEGGKTIPGIKMKRIFDEAKKAAEQNEYKTAIIYVNNFEDFAFSSPYLAGYKQAMAQMEKEMARAGEEKLNILVLGSTDSYYADAIPLVVRGFNQEIAIDSPAFNKISRKEILINRIKEAELPLACKNTEEKNNLINKLVKLTEYMSFVEIKSMVEKAEQIMEERGKTKASIGDFIEAYLQLETGRTSRPEMPEYNRRATTSHECGHAVNLEVMNEILREKGRPWHQSRDVNFITLDPRGDFLGAVFEGRSENADYPFEAMFTGLVCAYGGYSCEKMFFDMNGSSGISQDLAQASSSAKRGIEYFGFGFNTGKISNAAGIKSAKYNENVFKDMDVILTNAQIASDLITETFKGFNEWFTDKYSKLIGTDDCMIDGDNFRAILTKWKNLQSAGFKDEFEILSDMIMDIIKSSKNGKIYGKLKV